MYFGKTKDKNPEKKPTASFFAFLKGGSSPAKQVDLFPDDIIIAVMGPTGSGKSTFINTLTGFETAEVGHALESCTKQILDFRHSLPELAYGDLVFVDTPGFDDTDKSDADILKMVVEWLKTTYGKDTKLSGLLYFHRISDNRMAGTPLKNLRMFEELCGKNALQSIILATTMWDEVDVETGEARERELKSNPKYWQTMLARNSTTSRFMRTRESAFTLIDPLIEIANIRSSVLLQQELAEMRRKTTSTSSGQELFSTMESLVRQREDLLRRIRDGMKRDRGDKMVLQALGEEHQKLRNSLESTMKEMRKLKLPLGQRLVNMTDKFFSGKFTFRRFSITGIPE